MFRKTQILVKGKKYTQTQIVEMSYKAADAITLTGFTNDKELYDLLMLNCMDSPIIIDYTLKELADRYNFRATKESSEMHIDYPQREAHATNVVLINEKIKIICNVRSVIATTYIAAETREKLPKFEDDELNAIDIPDIDKENDGETDYSNITDFREVQ